MRQIPAAACVARFWAQPPKYICVHVPVPHGSPAHSRPGHRLRWAQPARLRHPPGPGGGPASGKAAASFNLPSQAARMCRQASEGLYAFLSGILALPVCIHVKLQGFIYKYIYTIAYRYTHAYITLHYITLHYITLHYITLHYITLHYITLPCITWHCIALHGMTSHNIMHIASQAQHLVV